MAQGRASRVMRRTAAAAAVLLVVASAYAGYVALRSRAAVDLPVPTGPFAVGRVVDTATDSARGDRKLSLWTWYPAITGSDATAEYAPGAWGGLAIGLPLGETRLDRIHDIARVSANPAVGRFPLVILLPGLGFSAPQYAVLAEELASRGYVVVGVTPTGSANLTVVDGQAVASTAEGNPSDFAGEQNAHDRTIGERLLPTWVGDARFAADWTASPAGAGLLEGHVDLAHLAFIGHSFGGTTALQACHDDQRCRVGVNLDGAIYGSVATKGLDVPSLLLGHDGSCITGDCSRTTATDRADAAAAETFIAASAAPVQRATVNGTGHLNFTDYGLYYWALPLRKLLGLGRADGRRALSQTGALIADTLHRAGVHLGPPVS
ncbi:MAG: alpha/beta hydrolase [Actinomycetota bacterium]